MWERYDAAKNADVHTQLNDLILGNYSWSANAAKITMHILYFRSIIDTPDTFFTNFLTETSHSSQYISVKFHAHYVTSLTTNTEHPIPSTQALNSDVAHFVVA